MTKKLRFISTILCLLVCIVCFVACDKQSDNEQNTIYNLSVENAETNFVLGQDFELGDDILIKKIPNMNISNFQEISVDDIIVDSSEFDNLREGTYAITILLKDDENVKYKYYIVVTKLEPNITVSYLGGDIFDSTPLDQIDISLNDGDTEGQVRLIEGQTLIVGTNIYNWEFTPKDIKYKTKQGTIVLTVAQTEVDESTLVMTSPPNRRSYNAFETFDKTGMVITYIDNDGNSQVIENYTISSNSSNLTADMDSVELSFLGKVLAVNIIVNKIDLEYSGSAFEEIEAGYNTALNQISLPNNFRWENSEFVLQTMGEQKVNVVYLPNNDATNYNVKTYEIDINVVKASMNLQTLDTIDVEYGKTLSDVILPSGYIWQNPSKTLYENIGTYNFKANYIPSDTEHYKSVEDIDIPINLIKSNRSYDAMPSIDIEYNKALYEVTGKLYVGFSWVNSNQVADTIGQWNVAATFTYNFDSSHYNTLNETITLNVIKATPTVFTTPSDITADYGTLLSALALPSKFSWKTPSNNVGIVNAYNAPNACIAIYTPSDSEHYKSIEVSINIIVKPISSIIIVSKKNIYTIYDSMNLSDNKLDLTYTTDQVGNDFGSVDWEIGQSLIAGTNAYRWEYISNNSNYKDCSGTLDIEVIAKSVTSIEVNNYPSKTIYNAKEEFEIAGLIIKAYYNDGSNGLFDTFDYNYQSENNYFLGTDTKIIISYQGQSVDLSVTINKLEIIENVDYILPSTLSANYKQHLSDISLDVYPMLSWQDDSLEVGVVGMNSFNIIVTPTDTINYNSKIESITLQVSKIDPVVDIPNNISAKYLDTLANIVLPYIESGNYEWENSLLSCDSVGTQNFNANFVPNDLNNYNTISMVIPVLVEKADTTATVSYSGEAIYENKKINEIILEIDDSNVTGVVSLDIGQTLLVGNTSYNWTFTPTDDTHYNTCSGQIRLTIVARIMESLTYSGESIKTDYKARELFTTSGMLFYANYNNGDVVTLNNYDVTILYQTGDTMLHPGDGYVTFSYEGVLLQYNINAVAKIVTTATINSPDILSYAINDLPLISELEITIQSSTTQGQVSFVVEQNVNYGIFDYQWRFTPDNWIDYEVYIATKQISIYMIVDIPSLVVSSGVDNAPYNGITKKFEFSNSIDLDTINNLIVKDVENNEFVIKFNDNASIKANAVDDLSLNLYYGGLFADSIILTTNFVNLDIYNDISINCGDKDLVSVDPKYISYIRNIYQEIMLLNDVISVKVNNVDIDENYLLPENGTEAIVGYYKGEFVLSQNLNIIYDINVRYIALPIANMTFGTTNFELSKLSSKITYITDVLDNLTYTNNGTLVIYDELGNIVTLPSGSAISYGKYVFVADNNGLNQVVNVNVERSVISTYDLALVSNDNSTVYENISIVSGTPTIITVANIYEPLQISLQNNCTMAIVSGSSCYNMSSGDINAIIPKIAGDNLITLAIDNQGVVTNYYLNIQAGIQDAKSTLTIGSTTKTIDYNFSNMTEISVDNDILVNNCFYMEMPANSYGEVATGEMVSITCDMSILGMMEGVQTHYGEFVFQSTLKEGSTGIKYISNEILINKYITIELNIFFTDVAMTTESINATIN